MWREVRPHHPVCAERLGPLAGIVLLLCEFQGLNSGCQAWLQVPLPSELSCLSFCNIWQRIVCTTEKQLVFLEQFYLIDLLYLQLIFFNFKGLCILLFRFNVLGAFSCFFECFFSLFWRQGFPTLPCKLPRNSLCRPDRPWAHMPLPLSAGIKGVHHHS